MSLRHFISGPGIVLALLSVNFDPASRIPGPINVDNVFNISFLQPSNCCSNNRPYLSSPPLITATPESENYFPAHGLKDFFRNLAIPTSAKVMDKPKPSEVFEVFDNDEITREHIEQAVTLLSQEYGIRGPQDPHPGNRIRMSASKLKDQIFPKLFLEGFEREYEHRLARFLIDGEAVGHAAGCYYDWVIEVRRMDEGSFDAVGSRIVESTVICWVTQLVVKKAWRGRGLAKKLLEKLKKGLEEDPKYGRPGSTRYGILSSSPFAIMAAWRASGHTSDGQLFPMTSSCRN